MAPGNRDTDFKASMAFGAPSTRFESLAGIATLAISLHPGRV
jgi:hypothetical protein